LFWINISLTQNQNLWSIEYLHDLYFQKPKALRTNKFEFIILSVLRFFQRALTCLVTGTQIYWKNDIFKYKGQEPGLLGHEAQLTGLTIDKIATELCTEFLSSRFNSGWKKGHRWTDKKKQGNVVQFFWLPV